MAIELYSKATLDTLLAAKLEDAPSDGSQYARQDGAWAVVTGGVAWGAITGTVTDQTDLVTYVTGLGYQTASDVSTYVSANAYPLSGNPSGFLTSVPGKSFNAVSAMGGYYIQPSDFGNIVVDSSGGYSLILDFSTLSFPTGVEVLVFNANSSPISVSAYGGASVIGTAILGNCWGRIIVNNATNTVYYS